MAVNTAQGRVDSHPIGHSWATYRAWSCVMMCWILPKMASLGSGTEGAAEEAAAVLELELGLTVDEELDWPRTESEALPDSLFSAAIHTSGVQSKELFH